MADGWDARCPASPIFLYAGVAGERLLLAGVVYTLSHARRPRRHHLARLLHPSRQLRYIPIRNGAYL